MWDSQAIIRARHKKLSHICSVLARSKRGEGGRDGKNVGLIFTFAMCLLAESIHFHFPELDEFQICQLTCNSLTESVTTDGVTAQTPLASRAELPEGAKPPPLVYQLEHFCYTARKMVTCTRKVQPSEDALSSLPYVYEFVCRTIIRITGQEMLWSATRNPSGLVFFEVAEDLKDVPICAIALSTGCLRAWVSGTSSLESALCDDQPSTSEPATFVPLTEMAPARIDAEEIMANYQQVSLQHFSIFSIFIFYKNFQFLFQNFQRFFNFTTKVAGNSVLWQQTRMHVCTGLPFSWAGDQILSIFPLIL